MCACACKCVRVCVCVRCVCMCVCVVCACVHVGALQLCAWWEGHHKTGFSRHIDRFPRGPATLLPTPVDPTHRVPCVLQHKAPDHTAGMTQTFLHGLPHPGYPLELNPCDYWLFAIIKKGVQGIRHHTVQQLEAAITCSIQGIQPQEFAAAIYRFPARLQK